jgi:hypothetical protein
MAAAVKIVSGVGVLVTMTNVGVGVDVGVGVSGTLAVTSVPAGLVGVSRGEVTASLRMGVFPKLPRP